MRNDREITAWGYLRRFVFAISVVFLFLFFLIARIDNPRIEAIRFKIQDSLPNFQGIYRPFTSIATLLGNISNYDQLAKENRDLRLKIRQFEEWKEAALQLEQINAELRALNNLKFNTKESYITTDVIADSGSPFSKTAVLNAGIDKGVAVGAPAIDSFGLIGRVVGVGETTSRLLLLNDPQSQISALIMPDRIQAIVKGNNTSFLELVLVDSGARVLARSRVVTSGDGILPADLPIGYVEVDANKTARVKIAADYDALEFARVQLANPPSIIDPQSPIVIPNQLSPSPAVDTIE